MVNLSGYKIYNRSRQPFNPQMPDIGHVYVTCPHIPDSNKIIIGLSRATDKTLFNTAKVGCDCHLHETRINPGLVKCA